MIRNVVLAKLTTGYDTAEVESIQEGLRNLNCPGTRHYTVGADAGLRDGNWDFVIVADFEDTAAYRGLRRGCRTQRVARPAGAVHRPGRPGPIRASRRLTVRLPVVAAVRSCLRVRKSRGLRLLPGPVTLET